MRTIENLQITKFFPVKTPVGISQRGESLNNYSIGIDLYMPKFTPKFLDALCEANKKIYPHLKYSETEKGYQLYDGEDLVARINLYKDLKSNKFTTSGKFIFKVPILQIPTGIGMNIPEWAWCEVRTKSSNFHNNWTEVHGTVDMNYTYGVGVQILSIDNMSIESDQKFAQLVFHEAVPVIQIEEVSEKDWNNMPDIINKRSVRTGGFGTTGKFDDNEDSISI